MAAPEPIVDVPDPRPDVRIDPPSAISRFIYESDKIFKSTQKPKPGAFLPECYENRHETSVCHLDGCADDRVWHLGRTVRPGKTLHARVDLDVQQVVDQALSCLSAPEQDFQEHAVVIDWPDEKEEQKKIAVELATRAAECKRPPIVT
jgi:hypothetical protein